MRALVKVLIGFNEPNGTRHEAGEETELDDRQVIDLDHLIFAGTVEVIKVIKEERPDHKPYKPDMETKELK